MSMSSRRFLTTTEKAREMGVGVSTVKRLADDGKLEFVVTPGGHRRFPAAEEPFAETEPAHRVGEGLALLMAMAERLHAIGEAWACGELSVGEEHRQSYAIAETLDRMRTPNETGPLAMLACPPGELHDIALRMARLVLEWRGWRTDFLGASTPWDSLQQAVAATHPDVVVLSSRAPVTVPVDLGVPVILGGAWVRGPWKGPLRFRSIRAFDRWLARHR